MAAENSPMVAKEQDTKNCQALCPPAPVLRFLATPSEFVATAPQRWHTPFLMLLLAVPVALIWTVGAVIAWEVRAALGRDRPTRLGRAAASPTCRRAGVGDHSTARGGSRGDSRDAVHRPLTALTPTLACLLHAHVVSRFAAARSRRVPSSTRWRTARSSRPLARSGPLCVALISRQRRTHLKTVDALATALKMCTI